MINKYKKVKKKYSSADVFSSRAHREHDAVLWVTVGWPWWVMSDAACWCHFGSDTCRCLLEGGWKVADVTLSWHANSGNAASHLRSAAAEAVFLNPQQGLSPHMSAAADVEPWRGSICVWLTLRKYVIIKRHPEWELSSLAPRINLK